MNPDSPYDAPARVADMLGSMFIQLAAVVGRADPAFAEKALPDIADYAEEVLRERGFSAGDAAAVRGALAKARELAQPVPKVKN